MTTRTMVFRIADLEREYDFVRALQMFLDRAHADVEIRGDRLLPLAFDPEPPKDFDGALGKGGERCSDEAQLLL